MKPAIPLSERLERAREIQRELESLLSPAIPFPERVRQVFKPTPRGVVGLADDFLAFCRHQPLRLDFQNSHCYVRPAGGAAQDAIEVPLQKSAFRALLARIAALCNQSSPDSVTPYRGEGELSLRTNPSAALHVAFTNTPSEQRLDVRPLASPVVDASKFTVLLRDKRTVTVYGHALQYVPNAANPTDYGSYGILSRVGGSEVLVALFRVSEVTGVFSGDILDAAGSA